MVFITLQINFMFSNQLSASSSMEKIWANIPLFFRTIIPTKLKQGSSISHNLIIHMLI